MKKCFTLLLVFICAGTLTAQKQANYWYFGQNASLNFNNDTVIAVMNSAMNSSEGSASISDADGELLFYTDGITVYNSSNAVMPNGTDLAGNFSSTQSALIVPLPGNQDIYYIFTTDAVGGPNGLQYSVVDMSMDNFKGDVTTKNVPLLDTATEKLTAVGAPDGGYWVMAHNWPGNGFYAYKVSSSGINPVPVISQVGSIHTNAQIQNVIGQMKFSPNGKKLAVSIGYQDIVELFDFNAITGQLSNPVTINNLGHTYGVEFSGDNSKLYVTHYNSTFDMYDLVQYDISLATSTDINNSKVTINSNTNQLRQLQLAPNGRIYVAVAYLASLSAIYEPNLAGTAADYRDFAVDLDPEFSGLIASSLGLPNFVQSYFRGRPVAALMAEHNQLCENTCIGFDDLSLNTVDSWEWHFPSATPDTSTMQNPVSICYTSPGYYSVTLIAGSNGNYDTLTWTDLIYVNPLPEPVITISNDSLMVTGGLLHQWYVNNDSIPGATSDFYIPVDEGSYTVKLTDVNGCTAISAPFLITGIGQLQTGQVAVYPNPFYTGNLQVEVSNELLGSTLQIHDNSGRIVWNSEITNLKSAIPVQLAPGMYQLRIASAGNTITRKLVRM